MTMERIEGNWKQLRGGVKQLWGKLTHDKLEVAAGKGEYKSGKIQKSHAISRDEARKQRIARGQNKEAACCMPSTPDIERYSSPNLDAYTGSISTILFNIRQERGL